ncbi:DUF4136 domain-containing protein [Zunongwangia sp. SCSIO 43204]|uniref:DUF4136 domain-containing protein n=1 Tax=Zunongwangia mangrovi TaxID=1334022 RepID=A0A1I1GJ63_9FLAO|nr:MULTISPECIES: DUF4136 domain-containing protein [Zunongwangia]UAB83633.1 DUF4136 domain-containing protein [Zunongwangia sp. SCSIO 43204]SFC11819.1 protein of unknown function [Zunongwangia mangrovi]
MKTNQFLSLVIFSLLFISCGSQVKTTNPKNKSLDNYQTYAYLPNTGFNSATMESDQDINQVVLETVNMNLENAGYTLDTENPDLLVLINSTTNIEENQKTEAEYASYPYDPGVTAVSPLYSNYFYSGFANFGPITGYDVNTYQYQEGAVDINLVDSQTKELVWSGQTSGAIVNAANLEAQEELINQIFSEFPAFQDNPKK